MPDPSSPNGDADRRDDRLAALLAVEPLDEVTRRRLVATALRRTARRGRRPAFVAAAVAAALGVGAGALLLSGTGGGGHHPVAAQTAPTVAPAAPSNPSGASALAPSTPVDLGDVGNLDDPGAAGRVRAALASFAAGASRPSRIPAVTPSTVPDLAGALAAARRCDPGAGLVTAVATGRLDGRGALVLVTGDRFTAVATGPCAVRALR